MPTTRCTCDSRRRHRQRAIAVAFAVAAGLALLAHWRGVLAINWTPSEPIGFYALSAPGQRSHRGQLVAACLPGPIARLGLARGYLARGSCPDGVAPVLKEVVAVGGDEIALDSLGLTVNGGRLPATAPLPHDPSGQPLGTPRLPTRLRPGAVLLCSSFSAGSWDSRYFGVVPQASIVALAKPLWTVRRSSHNGPS